MNTTLITDNDSLNSMADELDRSLKAKTLTRKRMRDFLESAYRMGVVAQRREMQKRLGR